MLGVRVKCEVCKHIWYNKDYLTCDAFPEGIPNEISSEKVTHTISYKGDKGIHFEQAN